jgi:hypothetical protein
MSCILFLDPTVDTTWLSFNVAIAQAAKSLGYSVLAEKLSEPETEEKQTPPRQISLAIPRSHVVTDQLGRDQRMTVAREGVTVVFARDQRGRSTLHVSGDNRSEAELRAIGKELSERVVQRYVYQRLMDECRARGFLVTEEETDAHQAIHLRIRHWES